MKAVIASVLDDPHSMGVETLAVISQWLGVPASAIVRFAQTSARGRRADAAPAQGRFARASARERLSAARALFSSGDDRDGAGGNTPFALLGLFVEASQLSLDHIPEKIAADRFYKAVGLIGAANMIYVAGVRRSFAVAALATQQAGRYRPGDLPIGISFAPYAAQTLVTV